MADPTKRIPKTKPKTPSERIPKTKPKLTKTMIKMGLRKEFVDSDNPASLNNAFTLGKVTNYIAGLLNSEFKKQVEAVKEDKAKAKTKDKAKANTVTKKKGGKVKKRK